VLLGWVISLITTVLLGLQWIAMCIGFLGCCGCKISPPPDTAKNHVGPKPRYCCGLITNPFNKQTTMAVGLFLAVSCAVISSAGTFLRKFLIFDGSTPMRSAFTCFDICRLSLFFYGVSKLIIYGQLYAKVKSSTRVDGNPAKSKFILQLIVGVCCAIFGLAVLAGSILNMPEVNSNFCVCRTPPSTSIVYLICDWTISFTLLFYFSKPVILLLRSDGTPTPQIWRVIAVQQFLLAVAMLMVSPILISVFIYGSIITDIYGGAASLAYGSFPAIDLTICCFSQAIAARKLWMISRNCLFFDLKEEIKPLEEPLINDQQRKKTKPLTSRSTIRSNKQLTMTSHTEDARLFLSKSSMASLNRIQVIEENTKESQMIAPATESASTIDSGAYLLSPKNKKHSLAMNSSSDDSVSTPRATDGTKQIMRNSDWKMVEKNSGEAV
jgi:hypothetical protein